MSNNKDNWTKRRFTLTLTGRQANTILLALANESVDEGSDQLCYKCYKAFGRKLNDQGFWKVKE